MNQNMSFGEYFDAYADEQQAVRARQARAAQEAETAAETARQQAAAARQAEENRLKQLKEYYTGRLAADGREAGNMLRAAGKHPDVLMASEAGRSWGRRKYEFAPWGWILDTKIYEIERVEQLTKDPGEYAGLEEKTVEYNYQHDVLSLDGLMYTVKGMVSEKSLDRYSKDGRHLRDNKGGAFGRLVIYDFDTRYLQPEECGFEASYLQGRKRLASLLLRNQVGPALNA